MSDNQVIPEAAVGAAAIVAELRLFNHHKAADFIEAAAPQMLAVAWDTAIAEGEGGGWLHDYAAGDLRKRNPYRTAK